MKFLFQIFLLSLVVYLIGGGCGNPSSTPVLPVASTQASNGLMLAKETGSLSVWAAQGDRQTAEDILKAIETNFKQICAVLQTKCQFPVVVEVYPDQASFDEHVINPEMRGFFAISGSPSIIQMVSPANPSPHQISYEDGVSVVVHEFVHLALDEINPDLPDWLDEGTAIYIGPHKPYTTVCQVAFPFDMMTSFEKLEKDYNSVQASDLFAYTMVDFMISSYGMEKLNLLLRTPEEMEEILGVPEDTLEDNWHSFMQTHYHNKGSKTFPNP